MCRSAFDAYNTGFAVFTKSDQNAAATNNEDARKAYNPSEWTWSVSQLNPLLNLVLSVEQ